MKALLLALFLSSYVVLVSCSTRENDFSVSPDLLLAIETTEKQQNTYNHYENIYNIHSVYKGCCILNKPRMDFVELVREIYEKKTNLDFDVNNVFIGYTPKATIVFVVPINPEKWEDAEGYALMFDKKTGSLIEFGQMIQ